ncbi:sensor histidine kinase [Flavobacterium sp.]|uniref:sensor histidine kinase n=1 Tax=Flavobacterium sp. TaxID=239 RepID=UPI0039E63443
MEGSQNINVVFWLGTCIMLLFALGLIAVVLAYQRHLFKIKKKEAALMLETAFVSEMKERKRVAADLHDSVLGDLGAMRVYLSILKKEYGSSDLFQELDEAIVQALENTRLISHNLMPPLLESQGFTAALEEHFQRLSVKTRIAFQVSSSPELTIDPLRWYALYRVVQEFANNIVKYSGAKTCRVVLRDESGVLLLTIADDGKPYDFAQCLKNSQGLGLQNIKSRLETIGASLQQIPVPNGNEFTITLKM